jgi:tetratricopeptide (TPR) repeat protein
VIFISYRREDVQDAAWSLADKLAVRYGPEHVFLDREKIDLGTDWRQRIDQALSRTRILLAMIGPRWLSTSDEWGRRRIDRDDDVLAYELSKAQEKGLTVVPLYLHGVKPPPADALPPRLAYLADRQGLAFEIPRDLPAVYATVEEFGIDPPPPPPERRGTQRVFLSALSGAGAPFGREAELATLDESLSSGQVNIVVITALGGQGKSSLVNTWLAGLAQQQYRGLAAVFGWRFDHASETNKEASADLFVSAALQWFGDADPTRGSPWEKGLRLAELLRRQPTLLVLDGLEALQHPLPPHLGELKEQSLQALVRELAAHNPGLCIVTSRLPLSDVGSFVGRTVREIQLGALSDAAGAGLLTNLGVLGTDAELRSASREFRGHALSLTLLGTYLVDARDGDIRCRHELPGSEGDQAKRMMEVYERWLGEGPEIQILRLLGVFNRPATPDALESIRMLPAIPCLTDQLVAMRRADWNRTVKRLKTLKLLSDRALNTEEDFLPELLDTHALVRQHFAEQLRTRFPEAWRLGNSRLFDYYKGTEPSLPDTLDQMMPLFHAVAHGCNADRRQEAWTDVYWPRVRRGDDGYSAIALGAYGLDLAALTNFFEECWDRPGADLSPVTQGQLLSETGFDLRGVGRLEESAEVQRSALQTHVALGQWLAAANSAGNLSEVLVVMGRLDEAVRDAQTSIELAQRGGFVGMQSTNLAALGDALHQMGRDDEAEACFTQAEALAKSQDSHLEFLHALRGFHFCDLLLERGRFQEALTRASYILELDARLHLPHGTGLAHLVIARATLGLSGAPEQADTLAIGRHLEDGLDQLKLAGHQELVVRALLTIADIRCALGDVDQAQEALDEAWAGAARGQMKLYVADAYLQHAALLLARRDVAKARPALQKARMLVSQMKYRRRERLVRMLEQGLV